MLTSIAVLNQSEFAEMGQWESDEFLSSSILTLWPGSSKEAPDLLA